MATKKTVTVYAGLFQPLHLGQAHILTQALENSELVIVLVGSAFKARTIKNPFTFDERKEMIESWYAESGIRGCHLVICPVRDEPYNNAKWIQSVQETVAKAIGGEGWFKNSVDIYITGHESYFPHFPQWKPMHLKTLPFSRDLSGTKLRKRLFDGEGGLDSVSWPDVPKSTLNFLRSFVNYPAYKQLQDEYYFIEAYKSQYAGLRYPPNFLTVDAVVIQSGHILLVQRAQLPGRGLWALPGGHVKQHQRLQQAVIAELTEETGIKMSPEVLIRSIQAKETFDDPERSLRGRTLTIAYLMRLDDSKPLPKVKGMNAPLEDTGGKIIVETLKAEWVPISEALSNTELWFEDHDAIAATMVGMIKD